MSERNLRKALIDDLEQIEDNARLYRQGRNSAYQAVAVQLRNLLLGYDRSLVRRLLPGATFHEFGELPGGPAPPLPDSNDKTVTVAYVNPRGSIQLGGPAGAQLELSFGEVELSLDEWLEQWIFNPDVKLGRLITATANDEVAHTENKIAQTIRKANEWRFAGGAAGRELHAMAIVALGEYVATRIRQMLGSG